jgi:fumarate reductase flavoprotein subunit
MVMRKITIGLLIVFTAAEFIFTGCPTDTKNEDTSSKHSAYGVPAYDGIVTGRASGTHLGGTAAAVIKLTLVNGYITAVDLSESAGHTAGIGLPVIQKAPAEIVEKNSVEIDRVSGATVTRQTVVDAGKAALGQIPGYTPE